MKPRVRIVATLTTTASEEKAMKNHLTRPMRGKLAWVKTWSIGSLDAEPFSLRLERERSIEDGTGHEERGEQVRQNADAQGDGEAADRAGPVPVQEDTRNQRGAMAVDDGVEGSLEASRDGRLHRPAMTQLLPDTLEDEYVGVHGHADGQCEACYSGERQRRMEISHRREENEQVQHQRQSRIDAGRAVVDQHEEHDDDRADEGGDHALADGVGAQRRADRAFLQNLHARRQ